MPDNDNYRSRIRDAYRHIDLDDLDPTEREHFREYLTPPFTTPDPGPSWLDRDPPLHLTPVTTPGAPKKGNIKKILMSFHRTSNVTIPGTADAPGGITERDVAPLIESSSMADLRKIASQLRLRVQSAENKSGYYNNLGCVLMWLNISTGAWDAAEDAFKQAVKLHDNSTGSKDATHNLTLLKKAHLAFVLG